MADIGMPRPGLSLRGWTSRLVARPGFQRWASNTPVLSWFARRDGAALFDIVQGFVRSQVLFALVQLEIPSRLVHGPQDAESLARSCNLPPDRMKILLRGGVGIGLLKQSRDGLYALTRQGAALTGVSGLQDMILHHGAFYRDLDDPVALLTGEQDTELAAFWPYVFGAAKADDPEVAERYSTLMADTQKLVAQDTLNTVALAGIKRMLDVGGGSGAFQIEVAAAQPDIDLGVFDLPTVEDAANRAIAAAGVSNRISFYAGSFRDDPLPKGFDAISLVRVLYDHADDTVANLLSSCRKALPRGGRLIISEPMSGGRRPDPITDVYFAFYTLAMRTGRTRSAEEIAELVKAAGFERIQALKSRRPYVTSVLTAVRAD